MHAWTSIAKKTKKNCPQTQHVHGKQIHGELPRGGRSRGGGHIGRVTRAIRPRVSSSPAEKEKEPSATMLMSRHARPHPPIPKIILFV